MLGAKLWGEGVCGNVPFDHNPTSLDSFFIPLPLEHNILLSPMFFPEYSVNRDILKIVVLGIINSALLEMRESLFIIKEKSSYPNRQNFQLFLALEIKD